MVAAMKVVWKFTIEDPRGPLRMPAGAVILTTQVQREVVIWAEVDPSAPVVERHLYVVPTGGECPTPADALYVGTVQRMGGALVFHIYVGHEPAREAT